MEDSFTVLDLNVQLDISHTRVSDLRVVLVTPDGTAIVLFDSVGMRGTDFSGTLFDDDATTAISNGAAPFSGVFLPEGDLSAIEGIDVQGTWTLEIHDVKKHQSGTLNNWSITVTRGNALLAASAAVNQFDAAATEVTQADIDSSVDAILAQWTAAGIIDATELALLSQTKYAVANLTDQTLALATADTIYIDLDAAGHGWFIDATPMYSEEFTGTADDGLLATADSAVGRIDLLTVLQHEMLHILGAEHDDAGIMSETLETGLRWIADAHDHEHGESSDAADSDWSGLPYGKFVGGQPPSAHNPLRTEYLSISAVTREVGLISAPGQPTPTAHYPSR